MSASDFLDDLERRGLLHDSTDRAALAAEMDAGPIGVYCGFDPTSDSLHVGNLIGLLMLRRFQLAGHRPIALAGGATGMVGDPSGRSDERVLLDQAALAANLEAITGQLASFVEFDDTPTGAVLVDNHSWTGPLSVIEFLRDVGKHVTIGTMLSKESVRTRLESEHGISFTEFSYMLLQANDFWWLHQNEGCRLQVGGSDQWGNITAGTELIRKRTGGRAHGWTWPLLVRSDGSKFGKSAGGDNVWLSSERTSVYAFYQYWLAVPDDDAGQLLRQLTLLDLEEIEQVVAEHEREPGQRGAQRRLADELTTLVHGSEAAESASLAGSILFGGEHRTATPGAFEVLAQELGTATVTPGQTTVIDLLLAAGLVASRKEAKRTLGQGGVRLGDEVVDSDRPLEATDLVAGEWVLARKGKRHHALGRIDQP